MAEQRARKVEAEETRYVVLTGADRYCSSYLNGGKVILFEDCIEVGPVMAGRLKSNMRIDTRTNEPAPYFRDATAEEIEAYLHRLENIDPETGDPSLLGEAARAEAVAAGRVERGEMKEVARKDKEEEDLQPTRKRRSRAKSED